MKFETLGEFKAKIHGKLGVYTGTSEGLKMILISLLGTLAWAVFRNKKREIVLPMHIEKSLAALLLYFTDFLGLFTPAAGAFNMPLVKLKGSGTETAVNRMDSPEDVAVDIFAVLGPFLKEPETCTAGYAKSVTWLVLALINRLAELNGSTLQKVMERGVNEMEARLI